MGHWTGYGTYTSNQFRLRRETYVEYTYGGTQNLSIWVSPPGTPPKPGALVVNRAGACWGSSYLYESGNHVLRVETAGGAWEVRIWSR